MASRNGSAIVAPSPRRTVRRGNDFAVRKVMSCRSPHAVQFVADLGCPHQKRRTLHNPQNERRPAIVVGRRVADDPAHRRPIVVLEPAPERVRQELFGDGAGKLLGLLEQQRPQAGQAPRLRAAHRGPARVDRPARFVNGPPAADGVEILEREPRRIDAPNDSCCTRDSAGAAPAARGSSAARRPAWSPAGSCRRPEAAAAPARRRCCPAAICREAPAMCGRDTTSSPAARRSPSSPPR